MWKELCEIVELFFFLIFFQLIFEERGIIPISAELLKLYPTKINSHLSSWKRSTFEDLSQLPQAARFIKAGLVKESDLVFVANIDRGSGIFFFHTFPFLHLSYKYEYKTIFWNNCRRALSWIFRGEIFSCNILPYISHYIAIRTTTDLTLAFVQMNKL